MCGQSRREGGADVRLMLCGTTLLPTEHATLLQAAVQCAAWITRAVHCKLGVYDFRSKFLGQRLRRLQASPAGSSGCHPSQTVLHMHRKIAPPRPLRGDKHQSCTVKQICITSWLKSNRKKSVC